MGTEMRFEGRVSYDRDTDSFIYEIRSYEVEVDEWGIETDGDVPDWGLCKVAKCWRREGAEEGEEANFIHFDFMKQIVMDAHMYGMRLYWA